MAALARFIPLSEFLAYLIDDANSVEKAGLITEGVLKAHSCHLSDIAREMPGVNLRTHLFPETSRKRKLYSGLYF